jgi:acylphosphatase
VSDPLVSAESCRHWIVRGRVQGVFFRASAVREAALLGLRGWARNCRDGSVEVLAAGPDARLEALEAWLAHGPPRAVVTGVQATERPVTELAGVADFSVRG